MKVFLLLIFLTIVSASILEDTSKKDSLDVSYLPKEFREWHVRIVGDGYLRFLVPTHMEEFAGQATETDEETIYINNALHHDPSDPDQYRLQSQELLSNSSCASTDNNPPQISTEATTAGACVDRDASCTLASGTIEIINRTETDITTCQDVYGSCMESVSTNTVDLASVTPTLVSGWDMTTSELGDCYTTYTIVLNGAPDNALFLEVGNTLIQNQGAVDGSIQGEIISIATDFETYIIKNLVGTAGSGGTAPVDFDATSAVDFISTSGSTLTSDPIRTVVSQVIKQKTFTPAIMRTFVSYIGRTFTPAIFGDITFKEVYSRYGLLHVNKYRMLVNINGLLVIGKTKLGNDGFIHVPEFYNSVTIKQNGHISVKYTDGSIEYIGQLDLATFPNRYGLNIWGESGFEIRCNGAGGFGTSLGSWCKNTGLDGRTMWYYVDTVDSGESIIKTPAAFSARRIQQYHLNTAMKDLYLSGIEPKAEDFY